MDYDRQREHADMIKAKLSRKGYNPVSPFDIYAGTNPTYNDYLSCDIRVLLDCDGAYFCKGWRFSFGCNIEHDVARRLFLRDSNNFKIFYEDE